MSKDNVSKEAEESLHTEASENLSLQEQLLKVQQQYDEMRNNWLRCLADFDNFRKRQQKKSEEIQRYGNQSLLIDLLEPLDNFERSLVAFDEKSGDLAVLREGVDIIAGQLNSLLKDKWGLKKMQPLGQGYDPNWHRAVAFEEDKTYQEQTVIEEFQPGYLLHDRVLRPAMVKVGKPVEQVQKTDSTDTNEHQSTEKKGE